jgi:hypothetical protein
MNLSSAEQWMLHLPVLTALQTRGSNKTEIEAGTGARVQLSRPNEFFQGQWEPRPISG